MKPFAAQVGTVLRAASALAVIFFASPAVAGDRAAIDYIGYSHDARYFAFEEFGVQDGSGFAYSSIYVIDLSTDSWVKGTPVHVRAGDEDATLAQIRAKAQLQAESTVTGLGIVVPVEVAALNGDGVPDTEAQDLTFGAIGYLPGMVLGKHEVSVSAFPTTSPLPCKDWFDTEPQGFQLSVVTDGDEKIVHRDEALPQSRGCAFSYRLYSVVLPFQTGSTEDAVAIVSVYPGGFEGPDRRFIAVPLGL